jgi:hypothetical protein
MNFFSTRERFFLVADHQIPAKMDQVKKFFSQNSAMQSGDQWIRGVCAGSASKVEEVRGAISQLPVVQSHGTSIQGAVVGGAVGAVTGAVVVPAALSLVGFGAAGVTASSIAAGVQTGATVSGSLFAICQSVGAAGLATKGIAVASTVGAAVGGLVGAKL